MSYDLFFRPRAGEFERDEFFRYFEGRQHYQVESSQAVYENEDTGVYFIFELQDESGVDEDDERESLSVALNVNFFRPSFFGLEAESEVRQFVHAFDLTVSDPQTQGMGDGEYDTEGFLRGWNFGNEFGYSCILNDPENISEIVKLPTDELVRAWQWNYGRNALQAALGETKFVPRIMFFLVDGRLATAAVWPDGIPIAVPKVDYFIVPRKELAPRRFLKKVEDTVWVSSSDARTIFEAHRSDGQEELLVLDYVVPPKDVKAFVGSLPATSFEIQAVSADGVLNQELVDKYLS